MISLKLRKYYTSVKNILPHIRARFSARFNRKLELQEPAVTFTFDDFPETAVTHGAAILERFNLKGTFYISMGLCGKESSVGRIASTEQIASLIEKGHEIGCHTYSHIDAWVEPHHKFAESIELNKKALMENFPSIQVSSFAYPKGSATPESKRVVGERFVSGRGIYWGINKKWSDLNLLKSCELYCWDMQSRQFKKFLDIIDKCIKEKGWLIFFTHDVRERPGSFGCTPEVLQALIEYCISKGVTIKPVKEILPGR
jgi:peptidoglycan/xylan/chitin deacetylase (PgdA/CDA1 family)